MSKKAISRKPELCAADRRRAMREDKTEASSQPVKGGLTESSGLDTRDIRGTRIVKPSFNPSVRLKPHIGIIMADAYTVIAEEFRQLRQKVEMGEELTPSETRKFVQMADTVAKLAREEREQEKKTDPAQLSDEELLILAKEAAEALESGDDAV